MKPVGFHSHHNKHSAAAANANNNLGFLHSHEIHERVISTESLKMTCVSSPALLSLLLSSTSSNQPTTISLIKNEGVEQQGTTRDRQGRTFAASRVRGYNLSSGKQSKSRVPTFVTRCSPKRMQELMKKLNEEQLQVLVNNFEWSQNALLIKGSTIVFTHRDVGRTFGIPDFGMEIPTSLKESEMEKVRDFKSISNRQLETMICEGKAGNKFARAFLLYSLTNFLCLSTKVGPNSRNNVQGLLHRRLKSGKSVDISINSLKHEMSRKAMKDIYFRWLKPIDDALIVGHLNVDQLKGNQEEDDEEENEYAKDEVGEDKDQDDDEEEEEEEEE
ncbi:hypothetical protein RIF29_10247 [Crotalaria pallida]|uniref:Uncharacterized protein n=1 Tax=Crotalaria pallida TaxID=3830 RepID=A0AAN9ILQ7_CROPI